MNNSTLDSWLERLETIHPQAMDLGLQRVAGVAHDLKLLPPDCPVVTVAGTNGKGSCVAVMESMLTQAGKTPGAAVSPHLRRFNERIRIAGEPAGDEEIIAAFEAIEAARGAVTLTYFEFGMLASLLVFRQRGVDVMLLEVGLGGRLDAANIVDPDVAVITSIAMDHQQWLGDTRDAISREKAGILRPGIPAVIADPDPPVALKDCVDAQAARAVYLGSDFTVAETAGEWSATLRRPDGGALKLSAMPQGPLLPVNVAAGLQALLLLGETFEESAAQTAIRGLQPGGRRERRRVQGREYLLDVAHNPAAAEALCRYLGQNPVGGRTLAVFSAMADKDIRAIIRACHGAFDGWYLADQAGVARAASAEAIRELLLEQAEPVMASCNSVESAVAEAAATLAAADRLVVFGSFHTVAAALSELDNHSGNH